jgi:3-oxoacyl-[acyl-carrier protein] reductase
MSKKLQGQVAVVTGASKGIGAAIAEHLAEAGAAVVVNYASSGAGGEAVVKRIRQADGKAVAVQADVSKLEDVRRLFTETRKAFGTLDILVNNAGVYEFAPLEAISAEHFHKLPARRFGGSKHVGLALMSLHRPSSIRAILR